MLRPLLVLFLLGAALAAGCALNPQPFPPGDDRSGEGTPTTDGCPAQDAGDAGDAGPGCAAQDAGGDS